MTYLGVSHLSRRQTDLFAAGPQSRHRIFAIQSIVKGRMREQGRVSVLLSFGFSPRINSPTITDDEDNWLCHEIHFPGASLVLKHFPAAAGLTSPRRRSPVSRE